MTTKVFPDPSTDDSYSACSAFRQDFDLLPANPARLIMDEGLAWLRAWRLAFAEGHEAIGAEGLGKYWDEPFTRTIYTACMTFDPSWYASSPNEYSATMRRGLEWLQAWRRAFEDKAVMNKHLPDAIRDVAAERQRQREAEGWTLDHDDEHKGGELALAGACYALHAGVNLGGRTPLFWPWADEWFKQKDARRDLVRAAALIVAEIERRDRLTAQGIDQTAVGDNLAPGPAARFVEDHLRPKIIWHDAPPVIIDDDRPQIGRD